MSPGRIRPGSAAGGSTPEEDPTSIDAAVPLDEETPGSTDLDTEDVAEAPETVFAADDASEPDMVEDGSAEVEAGAPAIAGDDELDENEDAGDLPITPKTVPSTSRRASASSPSGQTASAAGPLAASGTTVRHRWFQRLYFGETTFDFVRRKRTWFAISLVVIMAGSISLGVRGLNLGIEFVGGTSWTVGPTSVSILTTQNALNAANVNGATVVSLGTGSNRSIEVQAKLPKGEDAATQASDATKVAGILQRLAHKSSINDVSIESVGPSWGGQVTHKAIVALIAFFILIAAYISIFFEWRMAMAAIVAVLHDIIVTVGIYSLSGFLVTPDTVVAFLTILGYSLYDTIVVFDRIRDNMKTLSIRDRLTFSDLVNLSMNQTIARSVNTSLVAIMPILAVLVVGAQILGATTLQYFGLALLVGLTTGAYSSIFIASPLVAIMKEREPRYAQLRERLEQRGPARWLLSAADVAHGFAGDDAAPRARAAKAVAPTSNGRVRPGSAATAPATNGDAGSGSGTGGTAARPASKSPAAQRRPAARTRRRGGRR